MRLFSNMGTVMILNYRKKHRSFFIRDIDYQKNLQMLVMDLIDRVLCIQRMKSMILYLTHSIIF